MCDVFDEVKRVLKKKGTCWVNIGDTYNAGGNFRGKELGDGSKEVYGRKDFEGCKNDKDAQGIPAKSLCNIPARFSIEMQNRGWILRNIIIWHKNNCMPCSVKDRFTVDFEYVFFFVKSKKYWFEQQFESISETYAKDKRPAGVLRQRMYDNSKYVKAGMVDKISREEVEKRHRQGMHINHGNNLIEKRDLPTQKEFVDKIREHFTVDNLVGKGLKRTTVEHWFRYDDNGFSYPTKDEWEKVGSDLFPELLNVRYEKDSIECDSNGRNMRAVWTINPKPFSEAHFAVYPEKLIEPMIKAGCPENGTVLDPFFGAGTTGVVAKKQRKNYIGIELNPEYIKIAQKRISNIATSLTKWM